jgi:hypothetical protein
MIFMLDKMCIFCDANALVELATKYQKFLKKNPVPKCHAPDGVVVNCQHVRLKPLT